MQFIRIPGTLKRLAISPAFDAYWRFAAERQLLYFRRLRGDAIWTDDPVLQRHRFTNVYRAADRVSQYLIANVIPGSYADGNDKFFRVVLYKMFNKIETWQLLENGLGPLHAETFDRPRYSAELSRATLHGASIYSAAYIMPSPRFGHDRKHENHLQLLQWMLHSNVAADIANAETLKESFQRLLSCPSLGPFLAFQLAIDLNYDALTHFDEMSYVVAGPGAIDGIRKCFVDTDGLKAAEIIQLMAEIAPQEFERLGLTFHTLWGRPLQLIDCQNLFCEVDKYCRAVHPELVGATGRTRIKQRLQGRRERLPSPAFPSGWALQTSELPPVQRLSLAASA